jgi:MFS family permease
VGTFLGGFLADRLALRDRRWYVRVSVLGGITAFLPYFYVILGDDTRSVLLVLAAVSVVNSLYLAPSIAICHALVPLRMRAVTSAILLFVLNVIGLGLGPLLTGIASDFLAPLAGDQNLRWAMALTACVGALAILAFLFALRLLPADLARGAGPAGSR